jgi:hypothetical protein
MNKDIIRLLGINSAIISLILFSAGCKNEERAPVIKRPDTTAVKIQPPEPELKI